MTGLNMDISENLISVNHLQDINEISEQIQEDPGILKEYLSQLPEKALRFGLKVVIAVVVFMICRKIIQLLSKALKKALEKAGTGKTAITFLDTFMTFTLYFFLIMTILVAFGVSATSAVAILGSFGVTLGLALQGTISNVAGGMLLLILKPFEAGDYIEEKDTGMCGTVQSVTIFYTHILTDNNFEVCIPNGALSNSNIINYSRVTERRLIMTFNISYSDSVSRAREIIEEVLRGEERVDANGPTPIETYLKEMGDFSLVIGARATVYSDTYIDYLRTTWAINEKVKERFDEAGIEIPFPQLDVHNK